MVFKNYDMALDLVIKCTNDTDNGILSYLNNMPISVFNIINKMIYESNLNMEYRGIYEGKDNKKYNYCFNIINDPFTDILQIDLNLSRTSDNENYEDMNLILYPLNKDKYYHNNVFAMYRKTELHKVGEKSDYHINYYTINKNNDNIIVEDNYLEQQKSGYLYYNIDKNSLSNELYIEDLKPNKLIKKRK